jgi:iron complex outermembrane receptor protein
MNRVIRVVTLTGVLAVSAAHAAGGSIRGTVRATDAAPGSTPAPLPEATVLVVGTDQSATTDAEGRFTLAELPPGTYTLQVVSLEAQEATVQVAVAEGATAEVVAEVRRTGESFGEEVVVLGTKYPEKRLESPVTVETVRPKDIRITGAANFMQALAKVKGVDFTESGIGDKRVSARGFNTLFNSRMLSMVDGRLAQLPGNGMPQANMLPTPSLDIHSVDVVVGPASALYGANAHAGVLNVTTKTPWDESGVSLQLRGGMLNAPVSNSLQNGLQSMADGSARLAGTVGNFGWKLTGQLMRSDDFIPATEPAPHRYTIALPGGTSASVYEGDMVGKYDVGGAKAEGYLYYRASDWDLRAGYGFSNNTGVSLTNVGRNHLRDWQVHYQTVQAIHEHWFMHVTRTATDAGRTYQLDGLAGVLARAGVDASNPANAARVDELKNSILLVDQSQLWDSEVQHRNTLFGVKLTAGVQLRSYQPVSNGTYLSDKDVRLQALELGGYAQADYDVIPERLRLVGAARLDTHSNYAPQFSPKLSAVYSPDKSHHVRLGYNRAFKSPTILENYLQLNNFLIGNRTGFDVRTFARNADGTPGALLSERSIDPLRPEEVNSLELGYKGALGRKVYVDVVGYHSWYNEFISPLTNRTVSTPSVIEQAFYADSGRMVAEGTPVAGNLFTYSNFGRARVAGADLGLDYSPIPELTLSGSFSYIRMLSFRSGDSGMRELLLNVPAAKVKGSVTLENVGLKGSFLRLSGRYQNRYVMESGRWNSRVLLADVGGRVPERFVADLAAGYTFENGVGLALNVFNLLNDKGVDILGATPGGAYGFLQLSYALDGLRF